MKSYLQLLKTVLEHGVDREDRTGTGTRSLFSPLELHFDLNKGFPLVTTKKIHLKSVVYELLWFLDGSTNIKKLNENKVRIWNEWADENGDLGPIYGYQWRSWTDHKGQKHDQIKKLIQSLQENPNSRRHIVNAWNVGQLDEMALPPCHVMFQFYVANNKLSCKLTQRSADIFLGVPFNIASYSLLTHMIAQQCNLEVGEFIWSGGDCHIYHNHFEQVKEQLIRKPYPLPTLEILNHPRSIFEYTFEDFNFINYQSHPSIKAAIAV
ncbi:MAG: thymidylate synthase [Legionellales bacterium]|nr:thymidylate synthase [Legionellales bacterium]